jgi:hypothetical protein
MNTGRLPGFHTVVIVGRLPFAFEAVASLQRGGF